MIKILSCKVHVSIRLFKQTELLYIYEKDLLFMFAVICEHIEH